MPPRHKLPLGTGRPKGTPNKDPDAIWKAKTLRVRTVLNMQERKRLEWVMKYLEIEEHTQGLKACAALVCEMVQHWEKGYELYFERSIGKKKQRRRILIA